MKYKDFNFELDRDCNIVTLYVGPNNNHIIIFGVNDVYINGNRSNLDEMATGLRALNDKTPDAQLTIQYLFDSTVKVVLTVRTDCNVINYEFWGKSLDNGID